VNNQFWQSKKVLITGHTGFKGGWLTLLLSKLGAEVHGYALAPSTKPSLFEVAHVADHCQSTIGDIRDRESLHDALRSAQPEVIFHMAAQPLVRESYTDPLTTMESNVMGTANVLDAARQCSSVKAIVVVTSDKCYLNREWHWGYRETEALGGHDPYSASKACTELVASSWQNSFFDSDDTAFIATARAGNVIGGGDWSKDRLIPDVLNALSENTPVILRNPNAVRPWQHVLEPLAGYVLLGEKLYNEGRPWAQAWNFGPNDSDVQTVSWIVDKLIAEGGTAGRWENDSPDQPHEAQLLKLDSSKARHELGWANAWMLEDCVREIAHWHKQWRESADMNKICMETLDRYLTARSSLQ